MLREQIRTLFWRDGAPAMDATSPGRRGWSGAMAVMAEDLKRYREREELEQEFARMREKRCEEFDCHYAKSVSV